MATKSKADSEPVFDKVDIITDAQRLFSQPPEVVAGALYDVTDTITIAQARDKVKAFLIRPIKDKGGR